MDITQDSDAKMLSFAVEVIHASLPVLPFLYINEALRQFLQVQRRMIPPLLCTLTGVITAPILGYFFIIHLQFAHLGACLTTFSASFLTTISFLVYLSQAQFEISLQDDFELFRNIVSVESKAEIESRDDSPLQLQLSPIGFTNQEAGRARAQRKLQIPFFNLPWKIAWEKAITSQGLFEYICLAIPSAGMLCAEWWAFEFHILIAGMMGTAALGAISLAVNLNAVLFMIPLSIGIVLSIRIGNTLGGGQTMIAPDDYPPDQPMMTVSDPWLSYSDSHSIETFENSSDNLRSIRYMKNTIIKKVFHTASVGLSMTLLNQLCIGTCLYVFREPISSLFTSNPEIYRGLTEIFPMMAIFTIFDGLQGTAAGILRGAGQQKIGFFANVAAYWFISLPLGLVFGQYLGSHPVPTSMDVSTDSTVNTTIVGGANNFQIVKGWGVAGQWAGIATASCLLALFLLYCVWSFDWDMISEEILKREHGHPEQGKQGAR